MINIPYIRIIIQILVISKTNKLNTLKGGAKRDEESLDSSSTTTTTSSDKDSEDEIVQKSMIRELRVLKKLKMQLSHSYQKPFLDIHSISQEIILI